MSLYLQTIKELSPKITGFLLVIQPAIQVVLAPIAGCLSDKYAPGNVAAVGMSLCTIGLAIATCLNQGTPMGIIILIQFFLGLGFSFFASPNLNAVMSYVKASEYGLATGFVSTMRYIGMIISMTIITIVFSIFLGNQQATPQSGPFFLYSMKLTLIIFSIMNFIGIFLSIIKPKQVIQQKETRED